ncbi:MAG: DUF4258 domain-containing protein [Acidobacteriota bacterium]
MYPNILTRMRESVRQNRIILTIHAIEEMDAEDLLKEDLEHCILRGEIGTRQWDGDYKEYKYILEGETLSGEEMEVVAKLRNDKIIIITAYLL